MPSRKEVCQHISLILDKLKESILAQDDATTTVKMQHFKNVEVLPKNGAKKNV